LHPEDPLFGGVLAGYLPQPPLGRRNGRRSGISLSPGPLVRARYLHVRLAGEGSSKILPIPRHFHICARNPVIGLFPPNRDPPADPRGNRPQFRDIPRTAIIGDDVSLTPRFIAAQVSRYRESEMLGGILFAEIRG